MLETLEICAGAGGAALGLEQAGFSHVALADNDSNACATLRLNRPHWQVIEADIAGGAFDSRRFQGVDLFTGGLPCPPFSVAGQQPPARRQNANCRLYASVGEFSPNRLEKILSNCPPAHPNSSLDATVHFAPQLITQGLQENGRMNHLKSLEWLINETLAW